MRSSRASTPPTSKSVSTRSALRKAEHIERPSFRRDVLQVAHDVDEAEGRGPVAHVEVAGDDGARPAADAGEDGHVLLSIRAAVGDRLADRARAHLELPEQC